MLLVVKVVEKVSSLSNMEVSVVMQNRITEMDRFCYREEL